LWGTWQQNPPFSKQTITHKENLKMLYNDVTVYRPTLDVASVAANTTAEQDFTVTGVTAGDIVLAINKPALDAGLGIANYRVKSANTVSITFVNSTAGAINPAAEAYVIVVATPKASTGTTTI